MTDALAPSLSSLQARVAREIVTLVRRESRRTGDHLPEIQLAKQIGTSRSPVQAALRHLAELGVVARDPNRGFFLLCDAKDWDVAAAHFSSVPDDPLYLRIAEERQTGNLPDEITEAELMRRFDVARSTLRTVLARMAKEGWVEQRVGHGWCFLPMIDSPDAYEESYLFRLAIEPSGLLGPSFRVDDAQLAQLRSEQQRIVDGDHRSMTAIELFESNSRFHETLAQWSHNRFIAQAIARVNQQRRLVEYRLAAQRTARRVQAQEHLEILDALQRQELAHAAELMATHLDGARRGKVYRKKLFSP